MNLSDMFAAARGSPIEVDGVMLTRIKRIVFEKGIHKLKLSMLSANSEFPQGVRLSLDKGKMCLGGDKGRDFVLWMETAPKQCTFFVDVERSAELALWNVWKVGLTTNAWIGASAMHVVHSGRTISFHCSDGSETLDLSNLRFELEHLI